VNKQITLEALQGFWQREWIEVEGQRDSSVFVIWAQAGMDFVDIRIPPNNIKNKDTHNLADLDLRTSRSLLDAEGFAGEINLQDNICTWTREINLHGKPEQIDAGHLKFDSEQNLIETGVHSDYVECWKPVIAPPLNATRLVSERNLAILICSKDTFIFGAGKLDSPKINYNNRTECINRSSYSEYSYGNWYGQYGVAVQSSNPFQQRKTVVTVKNDEIRWLRNTPNGCTEMHKFHSERYPCSVASN